VGARWHQPFARDSTQRPAVHQQLCGEAKGVRPSWRCADTLDFTRPDSYTFPSKLV